MVESKKVAAFTALSIGLLGIITGLFFAGNLMPSQGKGQLFDVRRTVVTTTTTTVDDSGEHMNTKTVTTTEKIPRGTQFTLAVNGGGGAGGGAGAKVQGPFDVWAMEISFGPSLLTVPVGTTVTWVNKASEAHTVTSATGIFDGPMDVGQTFSYTFTKPGVYEYYCMPHPDMTGSVTVK